MIAIDDEVHALAGGHEVGRRGLVELPQGVDPDAGGVDHAAAADFEALARLTVFDADARNAPALHDQPPRAAVVEHDRAFIDRRAGEGDGKPGVIELAVPVADCAGESLRLQARRGGQGPLATEQAHAADSLGSRERFVDRQADPVERQIPEPARDAVGRHEEGKGLGEVRGVVEQDLSFMKRLADERHVALREVPHAAVDELRRPARRSLGEVFGFNEQRGEAAGGGVEGGAEAGRPAAHNDQVEHVSRPQAG